MSRGRAARVMARRLSPSGSSVEPVELDVEEPLEIHLDDELVATTTRTPGHDFELAVGRCHRLGSLAGRAVHEVRYCGTGSAVETGFNVVSVGTSSAPPRAPAASVVPRPEVLQAAGQAGTTGALAFELATGDAVVERNDVRPEQAVDKVVGRLLLDGRLPAADLGLVVRSPVLAETAAAAIAAGFGALVAATAPSSAAVTCARGSSMTLAWQDDDRDGDLVVAAPDPLQRS